MTRPWLTEHPLDWYGGTDLDDKELTQVDGDGRCPGCGGEITTSRCFGCSYFDNQGSPGAGALSDHGEADDEAPRSAKGPRLRASELAHARDAESVDALRLCHLEPVRFNTPMAQLAETAHALSGQKCGTPSGDRAERKVDVDGISEKRKFVH